MNNYSLTKKNLKFKHKHYAYWYANVLYKKRNNEQKRLTIKYKITDEIKSLDKLFHKKHELINKLLLHLKTVDEDSKEIGFEIMEHQKAYSFFLENYYNKIEKTSDLSSVANKVLTELLGEGRLVTSNFMNPVLEGLPMLDKNYIEAASLIFYKEIKHQLIYQLKNKQIGYIFNMNKTINNNKFPNGAPLIVGMIGIFLGPVKKVSKNVMQKEVNKLKKVAQALRISMEQSYRFFHWNAEFDVVSFNEVISNKLVHLSVYRYFYMVTYKTIANHFGVIKTLF